MTLPVATLATAKVSLVREATGLPAGEEKTEEPGEYTEPQSVSVSESDDTFITMFTEFIFLERSCLFLLLLRSFWGSERFGGGAALLFLYMDPFYTCASGIFRRLSVDFFKSSTPDCKRMPSANGKRFHFENANQNAGFSAYAGTLISIAAYAHMLGTLISIAPVPRTAKSLVFSHGNP